MMSSVQCSAIICGVAVALALPSSVAADEHVQVSMGVMTGARVELGHSIGARTKVAAWADYNPIMIGSSAGLIARWEVPLGPLEMLVIRASAGKTFNAEGDAPGLSRGSIASHGRPGRVDGFAGIAFTDVALHMKVSDGDTWLRAELATTATVLSRDSQRQRSHTSSFGFGIEHSAFYIVPRLVYVWEVGHDDYGAFDLELGLRF